MSNLSRQHLQPDTDQSVLITLCVMPPALSEVEGSPACREHSRTVPRPQSPARRAFTLVELLVVISIIAILASVFLGAMYAAQDTARTQKTRATIVKLNTIIMEHYESYRNRRVPITIPSGIAPNAAAKLRLDALRELMRMEMPDGWGDVVKYDPAGNIVQVGGKAEPPVCATSIPHAAVAQAYINKFNAAKLSRGAFPSRANERAECLYLIVTCSSSDDESPLELFRAGEIQDTDNDGIPEFVDGWGTPIRFLRWASGFQSELQTQNSVQQPDPFDPRHIYPNTAQPQPTFALYPLIYSAGPDKAFDLVGGPSSFFYSDPAVNNNPFCGKDDPSGFPYTFSLGRIGTPDMTVDDPIDENNAIDNIHNHMLGTR
jgi:prepilin-type N-terminal cleavage/methylation domain-containing protein